MFSNGNTGSQGKENFEKGCRFETEPAVVCRDSLAGKCLEVELEVLRIGVNAIN